MESWTPEGWGCGTCGRILDDAVGITLFGSFVALFLNQFGGELSDPIGRKPLLLLGPVGDAIVGTLVSCDHTNLPPALVCRVIKQMCTTFSNTVMCMAILADFLSVRSTLTR